MMHLRQSPSSPKEAINNPTIEISPHSHTLSIQCGNVTYTFREFFSRFRPKWARVELGTFVSVVFSGIKKRDIC